MKHYIITRYNAPVFPTRTDLHHLQLDDKWLLHRTELFLKYTYPSVCAQTAQDFEWIVWCHPDSPQWLRDTMATRCQRATVIYAREYQSSIDRTDDILITTRIDSDDMIHNRFIELVQHNVAEFRRSRLLRMVYSFRYGYRYDFTNNRLTGATQHNNPFLSLFVDSERCKEDWSVYCMGHGELPEVYDAWYNEDLSAWAWGKHLMNTACIGAKDTGLAELSILKDFGVTQ